jgi:hypothetical protein
MYPQNKHLLAPPGPGAYFTNIREDMTIIVFASNPSCGTIQFLLIVQYLEAFYFPENPVMKT